MGEEQRYDLDAIVKALESRYQQSGLDIFRDAKLAIECLIVDRDAARENMQLLNAAASRHLRRADQAEAALKKLRPQADAQHNEDLAKLLARELYRRSPVFSLLTIYDADDLARIALAMVRDEDTKKALLDDQH